MRVVARLTIAVRLRTSGSVDQLGWGVLHGPGAALYCCPRRAGIGIQPTMVHPILLKRWSSSSHRHHRRAFVVRTS